MPKLTQMRLREIQKVLQENANHLNVEITQVPNSTPQQFKLKNILTANQAVDAIDKMELFASDVNGLKMTSFYKNPYDELNVSQQEYSMIVGTLTRLKELALKLLETITKALEGKKFDEKTISIKIAKLKDFSDLIHLIEKLKKVIQLPIEEYSQGGEIQM